MGGLGRPWELEFTVLASESEVQVGVGFGVCRSGLPPNSLLRTQRVQVPNNLVLGFWVIVILVQGLGKYVIIRYLDP